MTGCVSYWSMVVGGLHEVAAIFNVMTAIVLVICSVYIFCKHIGSNIYLKERLPFAKWDRNLLIFLSALFIADSLIYVLTPQLNFICRIGGY